MKKFAALLSVLAVFPAFGQTDDAEIAPPKIDVSLDTRLDFVEQWNDGDADHEASGFKGRYLNLMIKGDLGHGFSYNFRHRLNKTIEKSSFFDATDWIYVNYKPSDDYILSAGKQVVAIGGYEYDRAPINIYYASEFWNNIACYQFGASVTRMFANDAFMIQACQSPFHQPGRNDMYAFNLQWNGNHGPWQTIWSVNALEWAPGRWINYISLGNRFEVDGLVAEIDLMNRASSHGAFWLRDFSLMADLAYQVSRRVKPFVKYTYDVNHRNYADLCVKPGTEMNAVGCGVEYWPLLTNRSNLRLHADVFYSWGHNNPEGVHLDKQLLVSVGLKWWVDIFSR